MHSLSLRYCCPSKNCPQLSPAQAGLEVEKKERKKREAFSSRSLGQAMEQLQFLTLTQDKEGEAEAAQWDHERKKAYREALLRPPLLTFTKVFFFLSFLSTWIRAWPALGGPVLIALDKKRKKILLANCLVFNFFVPEFRFSFGWDFTISQGLSRKEEVRMITTM